LPEGLQLNLIISLLVGVASAQETLLPRAAEPSAHQPEMHETSSVSEAEFVASDIFRSGSWQQPLWRKLGFEGDYLGGQHTDVGFAGA
jgi:hypothetical protein